MVRLKKSESDFFVPLIVAPFLSAVIYNIVGRWFAEKKPTDKKVLEKDKMKIVFDDGVKNGKSV